ncbi:hypothetical protein LOTGIDRAFT_105620, partial [Lottia gigantea]
IPGLVIQQKEVCQKNPESVYCIGEGARRGILECQKQFKFERWNCTLIGNNTVFGHVLSKGTREAAFIYAILSAGVVHSVTQSCSAGNLTDCSCDMSKYGRENKGEGFQWGGCSDNVDYGLKFSRGFVDAPEIVRHEDSRDIRNLMNLHNNEVGRQIVEKNMQLRCRCHGVSGSCAVRTCFRSLPNFRKVGLELKDKYEKSVRLARRSRKRLRRKDKTKRKQGISKQELVFVHRSPNYCKEDIKRGIFGTRGRVCNRSSPTEESCDLLCCGRGYNTQVVKYVERCHCKFFWCCYVKCKTCETMMDIHTCK